MPYGESNDSIRFDLDLGFKATATIGQVKWSVEAYLNKKGNVMY